MSTVTYLSYYDVISEPKTRSLMEACTQAISETKANELYFLFSSTGGSVDAAIALYNFLRALPVKLTMHNTGSIDSAANVVFLAADARFAAPHSSFLLHGLTWNFGQGAALSWTQLQETVGAFRGSEERMSGIIAERTKLTETDLNALYRQGETKDLAFATSKGLIQEVRPVKVPAGAPFFALNFA